MFDFSFEKKIIEVKGNKPLTLDSCESVWIVASGEINIFAVCFKDGKPKGRRYFFANFKKGEVFFGIKNEDMGLIATGVPNTTCFEIKLNDFLKNFKYKDIENWLTVISANLSNDLPPKTIERVGASERIKISPYHSISAGNMPVWVKLLKGSAEFSGYKEIIDRNKIVYITENTWLTCFEDSEAFLFTTENFVKRDDFYLLLKEFNKFVLKIFKNKINIDKESESERLKRKITYKNRLLKVSLEYIRTVITNKRREFFDIKKDNPMFAACKIIGNYMSLNINESRGDSYSSLENIARASNFKFRKVALKGRWWVSDSFPMLCFYKESGTPVAVLPKKNRYEINDVSNDKKIMITENIAEKLKPFGYVFYKPFPMKKITGLELMKFGLKNCKLDIVTVIVMGILASLLGMLTPVFTGIIFDTVIPEASNGQLLQISFILISCAVTTLMFEITKATAILRIEGKTDYVLQSAVWDRLVSLPVPFFKKYSAGELAMRSMGIDAIRQIMSGITVQAILSSIFSLFYWVLLFYYSPRLACIATILGVVLIFVTVSVGFISMKYQRDINNIQNKLSGTILQFLSGISKLKITGTEINSFAVWAKSFSFKKELGKKMGITQNILKIFIAIFPILSMMSIFSWIVFRSDNSFSTGDFVAFNSSYIMFQNGLLQMSMAVIASINIIPIFKNLKPILHTLPEVNDAKDNPGELTGDIDISHVSFKYFSGGADVLKNISIKINKGEFVAIVGASGSGKSTLLRLLLGFEKLQKGKIFYDGKDLETIDITEVRKQIGVVLQNSKLLQGSILNNIVGSLNLTLDDAWEAAKMAGCYDDIYNMPMKMHTVVSSGGGSLSGGQRQRIVIARALVKKPRIIFFDEATSALDNITQLVVSNSLERMKITRVVIAHRLSTIKNANKIYCLNKGVLEESGTFDELMAKEGFFYRLAKRQLIE